MSDMFTGVPAGTVTFDDKDILRSLISELAAVDTYTEILQRTQHPDVRSVFEEIRKDERNHIGRLVKLMLTVCGKDFSTDFAAGFGGAE